MMSQLAISVLIQVIDTSIQYIQQDVIQSNFKAHEFKRYSVGAFLRYIPASMLFFSKVIQLPSILMVLTIVKYKSSKDILTGLSKLDYLLKISIFQVYKDKNLQKAKMKVIDDTVGVRKGEEAFTGGIEEYCQMKLRTHSENSEHYQ